MRTDTKTRTIDDLDLLAFLSSKKIPILGIDSSNRLRKKFIIPDNSKTQDAINAYFQDEKLPGKTLLTNLRSLRNLMHSS